MRRLPMPQGLGLLEDALEGLDSQPLARLRHGAGRDERRLPGSMLSRRLTTCPLGIWRNIAIPTTAQTTMSRGRRRLHSVATPTYSRQVSIS